MLGLNEQSDVAHQLLLHVGHYEMSSAEFAVPAGTSGAQLPSVAGDPAASSTSLFLPTPLLTTERRSSLALHHLQCTPVNCKVDLLARDDQG